MDSRCERPLAFQSITPAYIPTGFPLDSYGPSILTSMDALLHACRVASRGDSLFSNPLPSLAGLRSHTCMCSSNCFPFKKLSRGVSLCHLSRSFILRDPWSFRLMSHGVRGCAPWVTCSRAPEIMDLSCHHQNLPLVFKFT